MSLTLTEVPVTSDPCVVLLEGKGAIDANTAGIVMDTFRELDRSGRRRVVIDCAGLKYMNDTGLDVLIKYAKQFAAKGGGIALLGVSKKITIVLQMLELEREFSVVCADRPTALAAVTK